MFEIEKRRNIKKRREREDILKKERKMEKRD